MMKNSQLIDDTALAGYVIEGHPGIPLDDSTRKFLEFRFAYDFRHVRIHIGDRAALASAQINARAFTLGRHVVFGEKQYHPETPDGIRLLAHELTHVVQQEGKQGSLSHLTIGSPDSLLEQEADLVADRILSASPLTIICKDNGCVLRRAVNVDVASAGIDVVAGGAIPAATKKLTTQGDAIVVNLTNGYNNSFINMKWAFDFYGHVKVGLGPGDSLANYKFGFVQFIRNNFTGVFYAGMNSISAYFQCCQCRLHAEFYIFIFFLVVSF